MKSSGLSFTPFKGLKEALDNRRIVLNETKVKDPKLKDTKTDEEVFSEAMSDVREIREFREIPLAAQLDKTYSGHER